MASVEDVWLNNVRWRTFADTDSPPECAASLDHLRHLYANRCTDNCAFAWLFAAASVRHSLKWRSTTGDDVDTSVPADVGAIVRAINACYSGVEWLQYQSSFAECKSDRYDMIHSLNKDLAGGETLFDLYSRKPISLAFATQALFVEADTDGSEVKQWHVRSLGVAIGRAPSVWMAWDPKHPENLQSIDWRKIRAALADLPMLERIQAYCGGGMSERDFEGLTRELRFREDAEVVLQRDPTVADGRRLNKALFGV